MDKKTARLKTHVEFLENHPRGTTATSRIAELFLRLEDRIEMLEEGRIYLGSYTGEFEALKARVSDQGSCIQRLELKMEQIVSPSSPFEVQHLRGALERIRCWTISAQENGTPFQAVRAIQIACEKALRGETP